MTNQEAIRQLKDILEEATETEDAVCYVTSCDEEALRMAIEALEESKIIRCKDCKYHCANYCTRDINGRTNMFYMKDDAFCSEAIMAGEQE